MRKEDHRRLKALAALLGKSMQELVTDWIHQKLNSENVPNAETLEAMRQVENRENLVKCKDIDDMFKKLGI